MISIKGMVEKLEYYAKECMAKLREIIILLREIKEILAEGREK